MAFSKVYSAQNILLKAHLVSVEIDLSLGLHAFSVVGLPDKGIEESKDRVSAAIKNSGFKSPKQTNKKIVVSLAPAHMRKEGPLFDLPIAIAYLLAEGSLKFNPEGKLFAGELALDGSIRPIRGALSFARLAKELGMSEVYVPKENATEAAMIDGISIFGLNNLREVIEHLSGREPVAQIEYIEKDIKRNLLEKYYPSFDDIAGQESAKRGLMIAVAGGHNIALFGPPGTGKTMLAKALNGILPNLSSEEALEVTEIYSASGQQERNCFSRPPMRAPHHTSSYSSIIGGGSGPSPGEITLAHRGVLFMDEFPEFDSRVIEALRQPLEERVVSISRSRGSIKFPASFMLVMAFNPCPCGNKDMPGKSCTCTAKDIERYRRKLSGPIMDRMDIWIEVSRVEHDELMKKDIASDKTRTIKSIISRVREIQRERFNGLGKNITLNSQVDARDMKKTMLLEKCGEKILSNAAKSYDLSGRGYHRTIKLARTIADIDGSDTIESTHVLEALQYRQRGFK